MVDTQEIEVIRAAKSKISEVDFDNLPFGKVFSDHMLLATYENGNWSRGSIRPYGDISVSPAMSSIHYGQSIFEGLKAFKSESNDVLIFRPEQNWERINKSAARLCMPSIPKELFLDGMKQLVDLDRNWVPTDNDCSLYIRPFMFATDPFLGVKPSDSYTFMIITSPVGPYYSKPLHLKVETEYTRAALGGVGFAKAAGNYAAAMLPAKIAQDQGVDQLIWTDAKEHRFIEEAGTMNMMMVIGDTLYTAPLTSTILPGVTRDSFLTLARDAGINIKEESVSTDMLIESIENNSLKEVFGVGTAATTAQVQKLTFKGKTYDLPAVESRTISNSIGGLLLDIKTGKATDNKGWNTKL
ncbi:MAG TPA: branched chain amino acid aminotransferase [Flavobacteriales bacterium]|nr:branched chain amino acid aminotransferase [Flavobacteriales bacterium]